jgi:hypothetical protein
VWWAPIIIGIIYKMHGKTNIKFVFLLFGFCWNKYCELDFTALYTYNVKHVLTCLKRVHLEAKHFKTLQNHFKSIQNTSKLLQNTSKHFKITSNHFKTLQNASKHFKTLQNHQF